MAAAPAELPDHVNETRQPELWGTLITFLIINDVAIAGRLWGTWRSVSNRTQVMAEDIFILASGIFVNAIIANLMVATHYGLGLHVDTVNARDPNYPTNLSHTFRHVWITMVLMSSFFVCIKMTLLLFYKRLFLITHKWLRVFWWANFAYIILWWIGATGFYLLQCLPVGWYYLQYYARFKKPVPGGMSGQCDATTVQHVAMPLIFSLISDAALLMLPLWAISKLNLNKKKKLGLAGVFGIGLVACLLELGRILDLVVDTDDKSDPSWGVAIFLILTAAEETTAVVCACLPVIGPQLYKKFKVRILNRSYAYKYSGRSSEGHSGQHRSGNQSWRNKQFLRVPSINHIPTTLAAGTVDLDGSDENIHLTSMGATQRGNIPDVKTMPYPTTGPHGARAEDGGDWYQYPADSNALARRASEPEEPPPRSDIRVRTDIEMEVGYKTGAPMH